MKTFILIKYVGLALNASRSLLLAAMLGPESFGILGTLVTVQQYLSYAALGVREGLTVRLAQSSASREDSSQIHASALLWGAGVGLAVLACLVSWDLHASGHLSNWSWVGVVALLSIVNEILINIHRDQHRLNTVALLEVCYNVAPLSVALIFGKDTTVMLVLQALAAGLVVSIAGYARGLRGLRWSGASAATIRRLLALGIPLALTSFFSSSVTSIYIFVANAMSMGKTVGLVAFANSLCTIVLFGSNMVAWAATSQSMRRLASTESASEDLRGERITRFFRAAVIASSMLLLAMGPVLDAFLPAYRGAEVFALHFCLLQAYGLLLYAQLNFLAVKARGPVVVLGYMALPLITACVYLAFPAIGLLDLIGVAILSSAALAIACSRLCSRLGLAQPLGEQCEYLAFPVACALCYKAFGPLGASALCAVYLVRWAMHYRRSLARRMA